MHLIMPMGGAGTRFFNNGYDCPKPLLLLQGKPFFYWSARSVLSCCRVESLTFVVLQEHIDRFDIDKRILEFFPQAVAQNKLYLCDVEDLVIRDSKGNVLTGNHVSYSDYYIDEFIPDNSTSVDLHILDRIKGARVSVSGTLVMETIRKESQKAKDKASK